MDMVVADAEGGDDLEPGKSRHERPIDALLGGGDRHAAHARTTLGEEFFPRRPIRELDEVEGAGEPVDDNGFWSADQQNVSFLGGHDSLLIASQSILPGTTLTPASSRVARQVCGRRR